MKQKTRRVDFRRKREGRTDYRKRQKILVSGKLRLAVRKSLKNMQAQLIEYNADGDKVILSAHSKELDKLGWKYAKGNIPSAYLTGILIGKKAKEKKIKAAILDIGLSKSIKGSRNYAVLAGAVDAGLNIPHGAEILPAKERLFGSHIASYAKQQEGKPKMFSKCADIQNISKECEEIKKKILGA